MKRLFKLAALGAIAFGVTKLVKLQKSKWQNLTESEVRAKLDSRLGARMPADKLARIQEKVVGAMRAKGRLREDEAAPSDDAAVADAG